MSVGVLSGFGTDSFNHVRKYGLDYPLIVHFHAVAFVSWLVLFTVQVALIRTARADIHRRLGKAGAVLAAVMVVLGPATAWSSMPRALRPPAGRRNFWPCSSPTFWPSPG